MGVEQLTIVIFPDYTPDANDVGYYAREIKQLAYRYASVPDSPHTKLLNKISTQLQEPLGPIQKSGPPVFSSGTRIGLSLNGGLFNLEENLVVSTIPPLLPFFLDVLILANTHIKKSLGYFTSHFCITVLYSDDANQGRPYHPWQTTAYIYLDKNNLIVSYKAMDTWREYEEGNGFDKYSIEEVLKHSLANS